MSEEATNYGVTFLENVGVYSIMTCEDCNMTWDEAVENLIWMTSQEGF